jgi:signal transduction histidine kinase
VGQLAAGIAHEINTPTQYVGDNLRFLQESFGALSAVLVAYREMARPTDAARADRLWSEHDTDYLVEEIPRATAQALDGVGRVADIVRAMKDFSHPGSDEPVPADLNRAIINTVEISRNEWKYVADLQLDLQPDLPPVPCLLGEIQQVVLNLVVNAAHAIAEAEADSGRKGTIVVTTRAVEETVEMRVQDSGTGIPESARPRIFEPFFTTKPVGRGTGQGLAISRDVVVRKHRGSITFETEAGRGTTFTVRLPLHPDDTLQPVA